MVSRKPGLQAGDAVSTLIKRLPLSDHVLLFALTAAQWPSHLNSQAAKDPTDVRPLHKVQL
jgi:hypothetical protein